MKQLLLYFLVFVVSALIFLQCAKMFPSPVKPNGRKSSISKNESQAGNSLKKATPSAVNTSYEISTSKFINTRLQSNPSSAPYSIMLNTSERNGIFDPYANFKNSKLALNEKWQRN